MYVHQLISITEVWILRSISQPDYILIVHSLYDVRIICNN